MSPPDNPGLLFCTEIFCISQGNTHKALEHFNRCCQHPDWARGDAIDLPYLHKIESEICLMFDKTAGDRGEISDEVQDSSHRHARAASCIGAFAEYDRDHHKSVGDI
jgi:hypothetical protein